MGRSRAAGEPAAALPLRLSMTNRLAGATSPYLLQHATNPVHWHQWGTEAFEQARARDVPIFLSIGYSTCYWCHVMERESFENDEIAALMNDKFVCIKVDREERPDVDDAYMAATVMMTGQGGWPMSVFLEPGSLRPFYCGTYYPPRPGHGRPSFPQVLEGMSLAWHDKREEVLSQAERLAAAVHEQLGNSSEPVPVGPPQVQTAVGALLEMFDQREGGFGGSPKFPQPTFLRLLVESREVIDETSAVAIDRALRHTLDRMALGGINDQLGGGFHRYSVDQTWTVPHFEKMLYDQAQLLWLYAEAGERFDDWYFAHVARTIAAFIAREMTHEQGGLLSAIDAEVDHREGLNYLWMPEEIEQALAADDAEFAKALFGLDRGPNFQDPHHSSEPPRNVLRLSERPEKLAEAMGLDIAEFRARWERVRSAMLRVRDERKQPHIDDKILAGWNGLAIEALARAATALDDPALLSQAGRAAKFVMTEMARGDGLARSWRAGAIGEAGYLEDHAAMIAGLCALHRASAGFGLENPAHLAWAQQLAESALRRFADPAGGLFDAEASDLFVRPRSSHDGAVPSGTSLMINALLDLHEASGQDWCRDAALAALAGISGAVHESPLSTSNTTRAVLRLLRSGLGEHPALAGATEAPTPAQADREFTPVEVFADAERIVVGAEAPASFRIVLRIKPGYHLMAARMTPDGPVAGTEALFPTRVGLTGGSGYAVYADYPDGVPFSHNPAIRVYEGEIEMEIAVEQTGQIAGNPLLILTYQACTDEHCLAPRTVELDVAIDRA